MLKLLKEKIVQGNENFTANTNTNKNTNNKHQKKETNPCHV